MECGSQVAMLGKHQSSAMRRAYKRIYGKQPLIISLNSQVPFVIPWRTNRFIPTGGVSMATSTRAVRTTPNQIGSKPARCRRGYTTGSQVQGRLQ